MISDRLKKFVVALYPRRWNEEGLTGEMLDVLSASASPAGRIPRAELLNVVSNGIGARAALLLTASVRQRSSELALVSGGALAATIFCFGEWEPWRSHNPPMAQHVGPFFTPGVIVYLSVLATVVATSCGLRTVARSLAALTVLSIAIVITLPHIAAVTRPSMSVLIALGLLSLLSMLDSNEGSRVRRLSGLLATVVSAGALSWRVSIGLNTYPNPDRTGFYNGQNGLNQIGLIAPWVIAAVVITGVLLMRVDRSLLHAAVIVSFPWLIFAIHASGSAGLATYAVAVGLWLAGYSLFRMRWPGLSLRVARSSGGSR